MFKLSRRSWLVTSIAAAVGFILLLATSSALDSSLLDTAIGARIRGGVEVLALLLAAISSLGVVRYRRFRYQQLFIAGTIASFAMVCSVPQNQAEFVHIVLCEAADVPEACAAAANDEHSPQATLRYTLLACDHAAGRPLAVRCDQTLLEVSALSCDFYQNACKAGHQDICHRRPLNCEPDEQDNDVALECEVGVSRACLDLSKRYEETDPARAADFAARACNLSAVSNGCEIALHSGFPGVRKMACEGVAARCRMSPSAQCTALLRKCESHLEW